MTDRYQKIRDPAEDEGRAITAIKVTLFGVQCYLPADIAQEVEQACAARAALAAPQQQGQAVYQIENDPEEWFDVDRAMYEGHDGSRKRILYSAAPLPDAQPEAQAGGAVAAAWDEGYRAGVHDERMSEANIGIAGFGAKVEPARNNPYTTPPAKVPEGWKLVPVEPTDHMGKIGGIWARNSSGHYVTERDVCKAMNIYRAMLAAAPAPEEDA